jgi:ribosomal protein S8
VPEFDDLHVVAMAATLAIHIKGLGQIDYEVLRKVSDHFMSIPSIALANVLRVLEQVGFVRLVERGTRIQQVIPNIPVFDDVYEQIGSYASSECDLNSHEQATLAILAELQDAPRNRDALYDTLGIEKPLFDRCLVIGQKSGIFSEHLARGRTMLISPYYFFDNLDGLADAAASVGASAIQSTLQKIRGNQGWPLALIAAQKEIGGVKLSPTEVALVQKLAEEGVIKPPTIKFATAEHSFVFTPKPGKTRLNAANREIYERAMALISAVRKGQLLPDLIKIRLPVRILEVLRDQGYIRANTEARDQYRNLVVLRVALLKETTPGWWQLHLNPTPENRAALDLAIDLLRTGALAGMEVNQEARIALTKNEEYIQSLISASGLKKRQKQIKDEQATHEFEQLLLKFD